MSAPPEILELIARFDRNADAYHAAGYNETETRRELIDPMFRQLGWDIDNTSGYSEAFKDVVHEDKVKVEGSTKAPDYCFRIGGTRKFFLEAKKPGVHIKDDAAPAYQLRRYAWTAKLPLSILTNFEGLAVYDCRIKPSAVDKSSVARLLYLSYPEYADRWAELGGIFSKDAVLKGSFDKYAETTKGKRGTTPVDAAFLEEIESWREMLAKNIARNNEKLDQRELNHAVQATIDRIIFLRMCEDRGIEPYGQLQKLLDDPPIYKRLVKLFHKADDRYNSGLFYFTEEKGRTESPDTLTPRLTIDDKPLKDIIRHLYYPESPYEFSVLAGEILGQVYEQFLGKVIRLTASHQAKVEDKPEVKKAGGVYYTPSYIVQYIVKNTVGKLLEGKTVKQAAKLRILDPACGSGSFLLEAYDHLLQWHIDRYLENGPAKHTKEIYQAAGGAWRLTTGAKKEILLNNIYGVDIDPQAVEVTKLSLMLKVLDGESDETISKHNVLFHERALPDLSSNIKCGNSLIGPDFYAGQQLSMFDDEERYRINAFDWKAEFAPIMREGGFNVVIGNPPYVRQESLAESKDYFKKHYEAFDGVADLYTYFMEQGIKLLCDGGLFSYIVSSSFLRATYAEPLRRVLKKSAAVIRMVDFGGLAVFTNAKDTYVCIPLLAKGATQERVQVAKVHSPQIRQLSDYVSGNHFTIPPDRLSPKAWALKSDAEMTVFEKIMRVGKPLGDYVERKFFRGLLTGLNEAFELSPAQQTALIQNAPASKSLIEAFVGGQDIRRYCLRDNARFLIVIPCGWTRKQMGREKAVKDFSEREAWRWFQREHREIAQHLGPFTEALRKRQDQGKYWWELRPCDYYAHFAAPKLIFPDICKGPRFYLDQSGIYLANTAYCLATSERYLLGFLNSRLFWFAISNISIPFGTRAGQYRYRLIYQYMEKVPIRPLNFSDPADKSRQNRMVALVEQMLSLHQQLAAAKTGHAQTLLQRQIAATDSQIDRLVYELYGLTEDEIKIVEEATAAT